MPDEVAPSSRLAFACSRKRVARTSASATLVRSSASPLGPTRGGHRLLSLFDPVRGSNTDVGCGPVTCRRSRASAQSRYAGAGARRNRAAPDRLRAPNAVRIDDWLIGSRPIKPVSENDGARRGRRRLAPPIEVGLAVPMYGAITGVEFASNNLKSLENWQFLTNIAKPTRCPDAVWGLASNEVTPPWPQRKFLCSSDRLFRNL
jgi:hypothetical protein